MFPYQTAVEDHPTLRSHHVTVVAIATDGAILLQEDVVVHAKVGTGG